MSKKINFGTITEGVVDKMSTFHQAVKSIPAIRAENARLKKPLNDERVKLLNKREELIQGGTSYNEAISATSTFEVDKKINALDERVKKEVGELQKQMKDALDLIPDELYCAYACQQVKGDVSATGKVTIGKKEYIVASTLKATVREFLVNCGCGNTDNDTAVKKCAEVLAVRVGGMKKDSKNYIKLKGESEFKQLFMMAFLHYVIIEKGVITVNDDNSLSLTVYED